jgi:hypothetical protein
MHSDACYIGTVALDLSGVQSDPDLQTELTEGLTDRHCTLHGPSGTIERGKYSVAGPLHEVPAESSKLTIDCPIMLVEAISPGAIAERRRLLG